MPAEKFGRYKTGVEENIETRGKATAKKRGEIGETLRDIRGIKGRDRNENVFARPYGLCENVEAAILCGGPGPARKKKAVCEQPGGGGSRCTDVPVWQRNREEDSHSGRRMWNVQGGTGGTGCVSVRGDEANRRVWHEGVWYTR